MSRVLEVDWADLDFDTFDVPEGATVTRWLGAFGPTVTVTVPVADGPDGEGVDDEIAAFYGVRSWKLVTT